MYLITASLLNSWRYLLESEYGNIKDFERRLGRVVGTGSGRIRLVGRDEGRKYEERQLELEGGVET